MTQKNTRVRFIALQLMLDCPATIFRTGRPFYPVVFI